MWYQLICGLIIPPCIPNLFQLINSNMIFRYPNNSHSRINQWPKNKLKHFCNLLPLLKPRWDTVLFLFFFLSAERSKFTYIYIIKHPIVSAFQWYHELCGYTCGISVICNIQCMYLLPTRNRLYWHIYYASVKMAILVFFLFNTITIQLYQVIARHKRLNVFNHSIKNPNFYVIKS